jgi:hypothetical protein
MVNRIAAWEAKDGTVHKTREEADRHDFEQFASSRLRKFQESHFTPGDRRWSADEIYPLMLGNAQELARCFPPRTTVLAEALAVPSVQRLARGTNGDIIPDHPH